VSDRSAGLEWPRSGRSLGADPKDPMGFIHVAGAAFCAYGVSPIGGDADPRDPMDSLHVAVGQVTCFLTGQYTDSA
jgi:hypothetical protein